MTEEHGESDKSGRLWRAVSAGAVRALVVWFQKCPFRLMLEVLFNGRNPIGFGPWESGKSMKKGCLESEEGVPHGFRYDRMLAFPTMRLTFFELPLSALALFLPLHLLLLAEMP